MELAHKRKSISNSLRRNRDKIMKDRRREGRKEKFKKINENITKYTNHS